MKEVYLLAQSHPKALSEAKIRAAFETDEVQLVFGEDGALFSVRADESRVDVKFEARPDSLGWLPDLLTGSDAAHQVLKDAKGFYRFSFEPGKPQASVAVFEALWCVRSLLEATDGVVVDVTSYKIHTPEDVEEITELDFDIRDHVTLHVVDATAGRSQLHARSSIPAGPAVPAPAGGSSPSASSGEADPVPDPEDDDEDSNPGGFGDDEHQNKMWVHSHGMSKFGLWDVEMFAIKEEDLPAAETFFHELCTDLAFGQGPAPRQPVATSVGVPFTLVPSDEGRANLAQFGVPAETFEGHESQFFTVVSPEGRHSISELLSNYKGNYAEETEEERTELLDEARAFLPGFKSRFLRRGLMEPLTFLVRAPFEVHPGGESAEADEEQLWVEVLQWDDDRLIGKVVDGAQTTTEWRKGAQVEVEDTQINAIAVSKEGRTLDDDEMKSLLNAERPM